MQESKSGILYWLHESVDTLIDFSILVLFCFWILSQKLSLFFFFFSKYPNPIWLVIFLDLVAACQKHWLEYVVLIYSKVRF